MFRRVILEFFWFLIMLIPFVGFFALISFVEDGMGYDPHEDSGMVLLLSIVAAVAIFLIFRLTGRQTYLWVYFSVMGISFLFGTLIFVMTGIPFHWTTIGAFFAGLLLMAYFKVRYKLRG